jgi:hypothetical protein
MLTKKDNPKNEMKGDKNAKNPSSTGPMHDGCCQPLTKTGAQTAAKTYSTQTSTSTASPKQQPYDTHGDRRGASRTRVTIKYDVGFPNQLYIRGKGANLSWEKGQALKNTKADEWVWETDANFNHCEFKVLINDRVYENGENHHLNAGATLLFTPHFY